MHWWRTQFSIHTGTQFLYIVGEYNFCTLESGRTYRNVAIVNFDLCASRVRTYRAAPPPTASCTGRLLSKEKNYVQADRAVCVSIAQPGYICIYISSKGLCILRSRIVTTVASVTDLGVLRCCAQHV